MRTLTLLQNTHKWLGLLVGLQLVLWTLSGLVFNLLDHQQVTGRTLIEKPQSAPLYMPNINFDRVVAAYPQAVGIKLSFVAENLVYIVTTPETTLLLREDNLAELVVDQALISGLANHYFIGHGDLIEAVLESQRTTENRRYELPVWRVSFGDEQQSALYFDSRTAEYMGIKVDTWRLFDWMWMLHSMDYQARKDFNHPLIILVASATLFIALTGILLMFYSFRRRDFLWWQKFNKVPVRIIGSDGYDSEIFVTKNSNLYDSLAAVGFDLPSNCGGGGSCAQCLIKLPKIDGPIAPAHQILSAQELAQGYRLACQMRVDSGIVVHLPDPVLHQQLLQCTVVSNQFLTPFIKELVIALPSPNQFSFRAGEYIQIQCPSGQTDLSQITLPAAYQPIWQQHGVLQFDGWRKQPLTRAYSMASAPDQSNQLVFNIRLALPAQGSGPIGAGSGYAFALEPGDQLDISGPFGYFHAIDSEREMIFVGGGAGMAPLRSHIQYLLKTLKTTRKIRFFYGARSGQDIFYQAEFDQLAAEFAHFEWTIALSAPQPDEEFSGPIGNIHQVLDDVYLKNHGNVTDCEFYYCGPPAMNRAIKDLLQHYQVPETQIRSDDFGG